MLYRGKGLKNLAVVILGTSLSLVSCGGSNAVSHNKDTVETKPAKLLKLVEIAMGFDSSEKEGCTVYKGIRSYGSEEAPFPGTSVMGIGVYDCGERAQTASDLDGDDLIHLRLIHAPSSVLKQTYEVFDFGVDGFNGRDVMVRSVSVLPNASMPSGLFSTENFFSSDERGQEVYGMLLEHGNFSHEKKESPRTNFFI